MSKTPAENLRGLITKVQNSKKYHDITKSDELFQYCVRGFAQRIVAIIECDNDQWLMRDNDQTINGQSLEEVIQQFYGVALEEIMTNENISKIFDEKCKNGLHPLEVIHRSAYDQVTDAEAVVKWCPICGSVVIDCEYDGRIQPGEVMRAIRPKILESEALIEYIKFCEY